MEKLARLLTDEELQILLRDSHETVKRDFKNWLEKQPEYGHDGTFTISEDLLRRYEPTLSATVGSMSERHMQLLSSLAEVIRKENNHSEHRLPSEDNEMNWQLAFAHSSFTKPLQSEVSKHINDPIQPQANWVIQMNDARDPQGLVRMLAPQLMLFFAQHPVSFSVGTSELAPTLNIACLQWKLFEEWLKKKFKYNPALHQLAYPCQTYPDIPQASQVIVEQGDQAEDHWRTALLLMGRLPGSQINFLMIPRQDPRFGYQGPPWIYPPRIDSSRFKRRRSSNVSRDGSLPSPLRPKLTTIASTQNVDPNRSNQVTVDTLPNDTGTLYSGDFALSVSIDDPSRSKSPDQASTVSPAKSVTDDTSTATAFPAAGVADIAKESTNEHHATNRTGAVDAGARSSIPAKDPFAKDNRAKSRDEQDAGQSDRQMRTRQRKAPSTDKLPDTETVLGDPFQDAPAYSTRSNGTVKLGMTKDANYTDRKPLANAEQPARKAGGLSRSKKSQDGVSRVQSSPLKIQSETVTAQPGAIDLTAAEALRDAGHATNRVDHLKDGRLDVSGVRPNQSRHRGTISGALAISVGGQEISTAIAAGQIEQLHRLQYDQFEPALWNAACRFFGLNHVKNTDNNMRLPGLRQRLAAYQLYGVYWMLRKCTDIAPGCLLCDEPGTETIKMILAALTYARELAICAQEIQDDRESRTGAHLAADAASNACCPSSEKTQRQFPCLCEPKAEMRHAGKKGVNLLIVPKALFKYWQEQINNILNLDADEWFVVWTEELSDAELREQFDRISTRVNDALIIATPENYANRVHSNFKHSAKRGRVIECASIIMGDHSLYANFDFIPLLDQHHGNPRMIVAADKPWRQTVRKLAQWVNKAPCRWYQAQGTNEPTKSKPRVSPVELLKHATDIDSWVMSFEEQSPDTSRFGNVRENIAKIEMWLKANVLCRHGGTFWFSQQLAGPHEDIIVSVPVPVEYQAEARQIAQQKCTDALWEQKRVLDLWNKALQASKRQPGPPFSGTKVARRFMQPLQVYDVFPVIPKLVLEPGSSFSEDQLALLKDPTERLAGFLKREKQEEGGWFRQLVPELVEKSSRIKKLEEIWMLMKARSSSRQEAQERLIVSVPNPFVAEVLFYYYQKCTRNDSPRVLYIPPHCTSDAPELFEQMNYTKYDWLLVADDSAPIRFEAKRVVQLQPTEIQETAERCLRWINRISGGAASYYYLLYDEDSCAEAVLTSGKRAIEVILSYVDDAQRQGYKEVETETIRRIRSKGVTDLKV